MTEFNGLEHLIVWVAEPDYNMLSKEPWTYSGTFLFLIETLYDKGEFRFNLSGCSALQAISNIVTGQPFYSKNQNEPLGRYNSQHPLEKLKSIGAIYIHKQEINTIYRRRYMTNEQCFDFGGYKYRCNDLLGYPLFIS